MASTKAANGITSAMPNMEGTGNTDIYIYYIVSRSTNCCKCALQAAQICVRLTGMCTQIPGPDAHASTQIPAACITETAYSSASH